MAILTTNNLTHVFGFLGDIKSLGRLQCVNRQWNNAANKYSLWAPHLRRVLGGEALPKEAGEHFKDKCAALYAQLFHRNKAAVAHAYTPPSAIAAAVVHKDHIYALCVDRVIYVLNRHLELVKEIPTSHPSVDGHHKRCEFALRVDDTHIATRGELGHLEIRERESGKLLWFRWETNVTRSGECLALDAHRVYVCGITYFGGNLVEWHKDGSTLFPNGASSQDIPLSVSEEITSCIADDTHVYAGSIGGSFTVLNKATRDVSTHRSSYGGIKSLKLHGGQLFAPTTSGFLLTQSTGQTLQAGACYPYSSTDQFTCDDRHLCTAHQGKVALVKKWTNTISFFEEGPLVGLDFLGGHSLVTATKSTIKVWDFTASFEAVKRQERTWIVEDCTFAAEEFPIGSERHLHALGRLNHAKQLFNTLDPEERNAVFGALYDSVKPEKHWEKWGEDAFYGRKYAFATVSQTAQAILKGMKK